MSAGCQSYLPFASLGFTELCWLWCLLPGFSLPLQWADGETDAAAAAGAAAKAAEAADAPATASGEYEEKLRDTMSIVYGCFSFRQNNSYCNNKG